jgi:tetratricopeptide (TPR) repeat protein
VLSHIDQGFHYAAELHRSDWVLAFLKSAYYYVGSRGYGDLLDGWRTGLESIVPSGQAALETGLHLGDAYLLLGQPSDAAQAFGQAREAAVDAKDERRWLTATIGLTHALVADGELGEALAMIQDERYQLLVSRLSEADSLRVTTLALAGVVRKMLGQYDVARSIFLEALSPVGSDDGKTHWPKSRLLLELGETLLALDDRKGALEVFEEGAALAETKKYDSLWSRNSVNAIMVLARMGRIEDAKRKLALFPQRANREPHFDPSKSGGYLALAEAEILWAEGSRRQAEELYRESAAAFAGTVTATDVWVLLGERLTETGELDRAGQVWQRARESGRETGHWHKYNLATLRSAELLRREGRTEEARELLKELVDRLAPIEAGRSKPAEEARAALE